MMTRRTALQGAAATAALAGPGRAHAESTQDLLARAAKANTALLNGEIETYAALIHHTDDFTLMSPFGGKPTRGFDPSPEHLATLGRFFKGGKASQEVVQTYESTDLAVLVIIERQRVEVGGLPEQDWPLRVTLVFRRDRGEWCLAHRHADPLVNGITLAQAARLARGDGEPG
jgi:ketosteroid isomerase-like protein